MHGHLSPATLTFLLPESPAVSRAWEPSPKCGVLRGLGASSCVGGHLSSLSWCSELHGPPKRDGCSGGCCQLRATAPTVAFATVPFPSQGR